MKQIAALPPSAFSPEDFVFVTSRVLELSRWKREEFRTRKFVFEIISKKF
jgi:hypothetical protein